MKKIIILVALLGIFLSGCALKLSEQKEVSIESGRKNCNEMEKSLVSSMLKELVEQDCVKVCEEKSYNYSKWECSDDKVICFCVKK